MSQLSNRDIRLEYTIADAVGIGYIFEHHPSFNDHRNIGYQFIETYRKYIRLWQSTDPHKVRDWLSDMSEVISIEMDSKKCEIIYNAHDAAKHWFPKPKKEEDEQHEKSPQLKLFDL